MKQDLTQQSDNELSLLVFNTEWLYTSMHKRDFFETIDDLFIYTKNQLDILKQDIADDLQETNK